jgi:hypothetical protein
MKRTVAPVILLFLATLWLQAIAPYVKVAELTGSVKIATDRVISVLNDAGYDIIGSYSPGGNSNLHVIIFTDDKLKSLCNRVKGRAMLAAAMKVGFQRINGKVHVSIVNPEYLFYAYFRDHMEGSVKSDALVISDEIKNVMKEVGTMMKPFGGDLSAKDLRKYRYMVGMPYFTDPVRLADFNSFQQGLSTLQRNLSTKKGKTVKVYEIIDRQNNVAVFGVGLPHAEEGEAHFLPIIGEDHVAAMPYEVILLNNRATILHGRFRFALHWPELTMRTFTKIMSSPGDVEDAMRTLVK